MSTQYRFAALLAAMVLVVVACAPATPMVASRQSTPAAEPPTPVPTFTPTPATPSATATSTSTPTSTSAPATATPTATSTPAPTDTPKPAAPTATRRPPTATPTPAPPTETPKPAIDFKVIEQRLYGARENGGTTANGSIQTCGTLHNYFIKVVDINNVPLPNILVRRVYAASDQIPPTGFKGPGMTEDTTPTHAGDMMYVMGDSGGARFSSEQTRNLSVHDPDIPNTDLIAGSYCRDNAECDYRKANVQLCEGHYSYSVVFQRQW